MICNVTYLYILCVVILSNLKPQSEISIFKTEMETILTKEALWLGKRYCKMQSKYFGGIFLEL